MISALAAMRHELRENFKATSRRLDKIEKLLGRNSQVMGKPQPAFTQLQTVAEMQQLLQKIKEPDAKINLVSRAINIICNPFQVAQYRS